MLVSEPSSRALSTLYEEDPVVLVWWATEVECASALGRLDRELLLAGPFKDASLRLDALAASWHEVQPGPQVRRTARRLLRVHHLRAADSLQLAAALVAAEHRPENLALVSRDARLNEAAEREGFNVAGLDDS